MNKSDPDDLCGSEYDAPDPLAADAVFALGRQQKELRRNPAAVQRMLERVAAGGIDADDRWFMQEFAKSLLAVINDEGLPSQKYEGAIVRATGLTGKGDMAKVRFIDYVRSSPFGFVDLDTGRGSSKAEIIRAARADGALASTVDDEQAMEWLRGPRGGLATAETLTPEQIAELGL